MLALSAVPATSFSPLSMKDSTLNYVPPLYHPFPSVVDSFGNQLSARQAAYIETAAQRRARVEFLQKREGERRVENWVRAQIENSAFMVSVSVSASQQPSAAAAWSASKNLNLKSHRRDRHQSLTSVALNASHKHKPQIHFSDSDNAILNGLSYDPSHGLTPISEEEPYIFYSTPKPSLAAVSAQPLVQPKPHYSSFSYASTPPNPPRTRSSLSSLSGLKKSSRSPRRHRRHQSDLESIPEDMEE